MSITVPADIEVEIQERVTSGRYLDDAAVIREAMAALDRQERRRRLLELLAEADDDEVFAYTPELMAEIAREADEADRLGLPIDPDVCP